MKLIKNSIKRLYQKPGIDGMYEMIRDCAAVCYQTDIEKMKLSPRDFVFDVLLKNGHTRPLEFGTVYLKLPANYKDMFFGNDFSENFRKYSKFNHYFDYKNVENNCYYVTTNFRCIIQGDYNDDAYAHANEYKYGNYLDIMEKYWCEPTVHHHPRTCYDIIASRGVTDDLRTHITLSSICESSRFCNYSKNKFGGEITFIQPYWITDKVVEQYLNGNLSDCVDKVVLDGMQQCEDIYMRLANIATHENLIKKLQPQQLKRVFALGIKAELVLCGFRDAWDNFFWRRSDDHADPEAKIISNMIKADMTKADLVK